MAHHVILTLSAVDVGYKARIYKLFADQKRTTNETNGHIDEKSQEITDQELTFE